MLIIFLLLKYLSECDLEDDTDTLPVVVGEEQRPLINEPSKVPGMGDEETAMFSSSEDVDYSKLCVICFEERKNCFFVPCGHSATCHGCAQKILSEESKVCPICRRVIRKSRRLLLRRWKLLLFPTKVSCFQSFLQSSLCYSFHYIYFNYGWINIENTRKMKGNR